MVHIVYMKQYNSYARKHVKFEAKLDRLLILPHFHDVLNGKAPWSINQMCFFVGGMENMSGIYTCTTSLMGRKSDCVMTTSC